ncbi:MAG: phage minor head protein [Spirochaetia bacterium]|jgi:hypothetical protein|nr:phage minor head protein [Spirochaetia bacterium]
MTLEAMGKEGYDRTAAGMKQFNTMLAKEYKKSLDNIRADLQILYNKITGDLSPSEVAANIKANPSWFYSQANKFDRLTTLQKKIQTQFIKASIAAGNMTVEASKTAITNNFYAQRFALDFASPVKMSFAVLNPVIVEVSVLGTPKVWNELAKQVSDRLSKTYGSIGAYQPKYGSLSSILTKNRIADLNKIKSAVTQGLIQGKSYAKTAKDIKKILGSTTAQSMAIIRTESSRNMNAGAYASHNVAVSQGLDVQRMAIETLDTRTRAQSQSIDGQLTDKNDQFTYPGGLKVDIIGNSGVAAYDIQERGRAIEVIDGQPPGTRRGRDPVTQKTDIMSFKNYDEWAKDNGLVKNKTGRWVVK